MAQAGNRGTSQAADKALSKAKKLKKKLPTKPVATGSRGDSGSKLVKPSEPKPAGPPNFPKAIPVRPGALTPRPGHNPRKGDRPSTQAERTHVHNERLRRNKELAPGKYYVSLGKSVERQANRANEAAKAERSVKGDLAKKYARKNPELFNAKTKPELKAAGLSSDLGVKLTTNAFKDLLAIGQTPVSTYHLAEPTVSATAHGDFKKAGKEAVKAGKSFVEPIVETAKHPKREFVKHPVFTGLMFAGAEGAVGRSLGRAGRAGALGKAGRKVASRDRVVATVPGTSLKDVKQYSPDVIRKGAQVTREKYKRAKQRRIEAYGGPEAPPRGRMTDKEIARRVDERIAVNEDIRRQNREIATHV